MSDILRHVTNSEDFNEKRKTARLDIPIKITYKVLGEDENKAAVTKDMSAGGCLILTTEKLPENTEVGLDISLGESDSEALMLKGRIVRLNREEKGLYEYGISFKDLSKDARRLFADFCFARMYEMIGLPEWPTDRKLKK